MRKVKAMILRLFDKTGEKRFYRQQRQLEKRYGAAMAKASCDNFDYAMGLNTGAVIYFTQAELNGEWVHLDGINDMHPGTEILSEPYRTFDRGMDVHLSAIAWVSDAPHGS